MSPLSQSLPCLSLNSVMEADLQLLANGAYHPLTGFMRQRDYERVLTEMRLASGAIWPLPIVLPIDGDTASRLAHVDSVVLTRGRYPIAMLSEIEVYRRDKEREAMAVYGTADAAHVGVARLFREGEYLLGGNVRWLEARTPPDLDLSALTYTPQQTRTIFAGRGWRTVAGFQTRNPIHRAHEYLHRAALELVDGLFIHPLVGETKPGDLPPRVRVASYRVLIDRYYPLDRVLLGVFPAVMRYAGPREAVFHALVRKNYGCTHFIIGRDHAGVGNYYGPGDARRLCQQFGPELGITLLFFPDVFYCRRCRDFTTEFICTHDAVDRLMLSGTQVRAMLAQGITPPEEYLRLEVSQALIASMQADMSQGGL